MKIIRKNNSDFSDSSIKVVDSVCFSKIRTPNRNKSTKTPIFTSKYFQ
jgi:hypothetical protein